MRPSRGFALALFVVAPLLAFAAPARAAISENFNSPNGFPPFWTGWTYFDPTGNGNFDVGGAFPDRELRLGADASGSPAVVPRAAVQRQGGGETFTDVVVATELHGWIDTADLVYGIVARVTAAATTPRNGYALAYETDAHQLRLLQVTNEVPSPLASTSVTLDPNQRYRLVLRITGSSPAALTGVVFLRSAPAIPLASVTANDSLAPIYTSGFTGLQASDVSGAGTGAPDALFDDFYASLPSDDSDSDGLSSTNELLSHGTDPADSDSDDDGLSDGDEISVYSTNPLDSDSDADLLLDGEEIGTYATNPLAADSDGDGLRDGFESFGGLDPLDTDSDNDGLSDAAEDSDADGLGNAGEQAAGTQPDLADSDGDGLLDGAEVGTGSFGAPQVISTTVGGLRSIDTADIDGDGDLDVFAGYEFSDRVAWHENTDGQGSFGAQQVISTASNSVFSVVAADFDGDDDPDLLSTSSLDREISWYENTDGQGGFGAQQMISTTAFSPQRGYAADIDGDGDLDALGASANDDRIAWYENTDGQGSFSAIQTISLLADGARAVVAIDLDGDDDLDVISASANDDEIAWYANTDGQGSFGAQQVISTLADFAVALAAADVDGDGDVDVLSASQNDDEIAWYENTNGAGAFGAQQVISTVGDSPQWVAAADVDLDGDVDVLSASFSDDEIAWYENTDGQGSFGPQQLLSTTANGGRVVLVADVDGDGDPDVLSASENDDQIAWYEQLNISDPLDPDSDDDGLLDGFEVANGYDPFDPDQDADNLVDGQDDFDADGRGNAAEALAGTDPNLADSDGDGLSDGAEAGTGSFGAQRVISTLADALNSVFAADLDADGDTDVLSASTDDDKIAWYENTNGQGSFGTQQVISTLSDGAMSVFAADLDRDGDADVLSSSLLDDKVAWYRNTDGQGSFGTQQVISTLADASVFAADLDGDGDMDVLSSSISHDTIAWYENTNGQGSFGTQQVISTLVGAPFSVFAADLDLDGDVDVLSASFEDNKIAWYENTNGQGSFGTQQVISTLAGYAASVFAADLDGDGDMDVLSSSLLDDEIAWYRNTDGQGSFGSPQVILTPAGGASSVFAADLDDDGDMDVLSASIADDKIAWYENTNGQGSFGTQQVISTLADGARSVFAADLDGDGDLDVLSGSTYDDEVAWYPQLSSSDPLDPDSDDDGLLDGFEVSNGFDPLTAGQQTLDPDGDGLSNLAEQSAGTDPHLADTDGDGFGDGFELVKGTDPLDPQSFPPPPAVPALGPWGLGALAALLLSLGGRAARRRREG